MMLHKCVQLEDGVPYRDNSKLHALIFTELGL